MSYRIVADKTQMDMMRRQYGARPGLEGPFNFNGRVLYYDAKEGSYYDPRTDFYVEEDEMKLIRDHLMDVIRKA
jgi:hypothetical protein